MLEEQNQIQRPQIIKTVAVIWASGAVFSILFALVFVLFLFMPVGPKTDADTTKCFCTVGILMGLYTTAMILWEAWMFYELKPMGYFMIKTSIDMSGWMPSNLLVWLVTDHGKRLHDQDVRMAFGLPGVEGYESDDWKMASNKNKIK